MLKRNPSISMPKQEISTQENAENNHEETVETTEQEQKTEEGTEETTEENKEETLETSLGETEKKEEKPTVGLDKYLTEKNKRKELEAQLNAIQEKADEGATKSEVKSDLADLAKEHNLDETVLQQIASAIESKTLAQVDEKVKPFLDGQKAKDRDAKFDALFETSMKNNPEYDGVASKEVIKQLAMNPANGNKTMSQILESTYGHLLQGKGTIETDKQPSRPEPGHVDVNKARTDREYFKQVMADPKMKAEYNDKLQDRIQL